MPRPDPMEEAVAEKRIGVMSVREPTLEQRVMRAEKDAIGARTDLARCRERAAAVLLLSGFSWTLIQNILLLPFPARREIKERFRRWQEAGMELEEIVDDIMHGRERIGGWK